MKADAKLARQRLGALELAEQRGTARPAVSAACAEVPSASPGGAFRLPALKA